MSNMRDREKRKPRTDKSLASSLQQATEQQQQSATPERDTAIHAATGLQDAIGNQAVLAAISGAEQQGLTGHAADTLSLGIAGVDTQDRMPGTGSMSVMRAMLHADLRQRAGIEAPDPTLMARIGRRRGRPLPPAVRARMEQAFDHDFDHVSVHTDPQAARTAQQLEARAFTTGADIWFSPGEFSPDTPQGQQLLAHELAHVVQADQGRLPTATSELQVSDPSDRAEHEADTMARMAVASMASPQDLAAEPARMPIDRGWSQAPLDRTLEALPVLTVQASNEASGAQAPSVHQLGAKAGSSVSAKAMRKARGGPRAGKRKQRTKPGPSASRQDPAGRQSVGAEDLANALAGVIAKMLPQEDEENRELDGGPAGKKSRDPGPGKGKSEGKDGSPAQAGEGPGDEDKELTPQEKLRQVLEGQALPPGLDDLDISPDQLGKAIQAIPGDERERLGGMAAKNPAEPPQADDLLDLLGPEVLQLGATALQQAMDEGVEGQLTDLLDLDLDLDQVLPLDIEISDLGGSKLATPKGLGTKPGLPDAKASAKQTKGPGQLEPQPGVDGAPAKGEVSKAGDKDAKAADGEDTQTPDGDSATKDGDDKKEKDKDKDKKKKAGGKKGGSESDKMSQKEIRTEIKRLTILKDYAGIDLDWLDTDMGGKQLLMGSKQQVISKIQTKLDRNQGQSDKRQKLLQGRAKAAQDGGKPVTGPDADANLRFMGMVGKRLPKKMQGVQKKVTVIQSTADKIATQQEDKQQEITDLDERIAELQSKLKSGGGGGQKGPEDWPKVCKELNKQLEKKEKQELEDQEKNTKAAVDLDTKIKQLDKDILAERTAKQDSSDSKVALESELGDVKGQLTARKKSISDEAAADAAAAAAAKKDPKAKTKTKTPAPKKPNPATDKTVKTLGKQQKTIEQKIKKAEKAQIKATAAEKKAIANKKKAEEDLKAKKEALKEHTKTLEEMVDAKKNLTDGIDVPHIYSERFGLDLEMFYYPFGHRPWTMGDRGKSEADLETLNKDYQAELEAKQAAAKKAKETGERTLGDASGTDAAAAATAKKEAERKKTEEKKKGPLSKEDQAKADAAEAKKKEDILLRKASSYQDLAPDKREKAMKALAESEMKKPIDPAAVTAKVAEIKGTLQKRVEAVDTKMKATAPFELDDGTVVDLQKGPIPDSLILNPEVAKKIGFSVEDLKRHKEELARKAFAKKAKAMLFGPDSDADPQAAVDMLHKYGGERKMDPKQMLEHLTFAGKGSLPPDLQAIKTNIDAFNAKDKDFQAKYGQVPIPKSKVDSKGMIKLGPMLVAVAENARRVAELEKKRLAAGKIETTLASNKKIAGNIGVKTPDEADAYVKTLMSTCQIPEAEARRRMETSGDPNITSSPLPAKDVSARMNAIRLLPAGEARSNALKQLTSEVPPKFLLGALMRQSEDGVGLVEGHVANPQLQTRIQDIEKLPKDQQYNAYRNLAKMTDMPVHELRLSTHNKTKKNAVLNDASRVMNDKGLSGPEREKKMAELAKAHKLTKEQFQAAYDKTIRATQEALGKYNKQVKVGLWGQKEDDPTTKAINDLSRTDLEPDELERKIQEVSRLTGISPADLRRYSGFKSLQTAQKDVEERVNMGKASYDKMLEQGRKYSPVKSPLEMIEHLRNVPWDQCPKELRWAKQEVGKFDYRNPGKDKGAGADLAMYRKKAKLKRGETFERLETDPAKILKMPANTVAEAEAKKKAWGEYVTYTIKRDRLISKLDETIVEDDDAYNYLNAMSSKERAALLNDPGAHDEDSARIKASFLDGCNHDPYQTWGKRMFEEAAYYNEALDKGVQEKADKASKSAADDEKHRKENEEAAKLLADPDNKGKKAEPLDIQDVNAHIDALCRTNGWSRKKAVAELKKTGGGKPAVQMVAKLYTMKDGDPSPALKWELDRVNKLPDAERASSMARLQKWTGLKNNEIKKAQGKLTIQNHVLKTMAAAEQLSDKEKDKILRKLVEDLGKDPSKAADLAEIKALYAKAKAEGLDKIANTPGFQNHIKSLDSCAPGDLAVKVAEVAKATGLSKEEVMRFAQGRRHDKVKDKVTAWAGKEPGAEDTFKDEAQKRNMTLEEFANYLAKSNPKDLPQHLHAAQGRIKADKTFPAQWTEAESKARKKAMGDPDDPGYKKKKNALIAQLMGDHDDDKILNAFGSMSMAERKLFIEEWEATRAAGGRMGNQPMPDLREAFYDALQCDDENRGIELLNSAEAFDRKDALKGVNTEDDSDYSKKRNKLMDQMQSPYGPNAWTIKKIFKSMTPAQRAQFMRDQDNLINAANKEVEQKSRKASEVPKRLSAYLSGDHQFQVMVGDADKARRADFTFEQSKKTQAVEKKVKQTDQAVKLLNWQGDRNQAYALVEKMSKKYELSTDNMLRLLSGERLVDETSKIPANIARRLTTPKSRGGDTVAGIAQDAMRSAGYNPDLAADAKVTGPKYGGKLAGFRADAKKVIEKQAKLQKFISGQWMSSKDVVDIVYGCNPRELAMLDKQLPGGLAALMNNRTDSRGRRLPGVQGEKAIELRALIKKAGDYKETAKEDQLVMDLKTMDPRKSADPGTPEGLAARLAWAKDLPPDQRLAELNKLAPQIARDAQNNPAEAITRAFLRGTIGGEANVLTGPMAQQVQAAAGLPKKERDEFLKQLSELGGYADVKALETAAKKSQSNLKVAAEYQKALALPAGAERIEKLEKIFAECKLTESELDQVLLMAEENGMLTKPVKPVPERVSAQLDIIKELTDPKERQAKLKELARLWGLSVPDLVAHVNKKADDARKQRELKGRAGREADEIRRKIKKGDEDEIKKIIEKYGKDPEHFKLILEQYPEGAAKLKKALRDEYGKNDSDCVDLMAIIDRAEKFTPKPELPEGVTEDVSKELQDIMRRFPEGSAQMDEARKQAIAQFQVAKALNDGDMSMVKAHADHGVKYFDEELERHKTALDDEVNGSWLYVSDDRIAEIIKRIPHDMLVALAEKYPGLMKDTLDGIGGDVYDDVKQKLDTGRTAMKLPFEQRKKEISKARVDYKFEKLEGEFDAWFTVDRSRIRELLGDCSPEEMRMLDAKFGGRLQQELDEAMKPTLFECAVAVVAVVALVAAAVLVPGIGATLLVGALAAASALGGTGTLYGMGRDAETLAIKGKIGASKTDPQGNYELDKGKVDGSVDMLQKELNSTLWVSDSALYGALARLNPRELMSLRERMNKPPPEGIQITDSDGNVLTLEGLIQKHISGDEKAKCVAMMADAEDHVNKRDRRTELKEVARDLVIKDRMAELRRDPRNARKSPEEIYKLAVADKKLLNNKIQQRVKKIKDSANSLFKAIDGWGDDEKTVLKTLAGLSPEEIDLVKVEYRRHFGKDLETQMREDMGLGDWKPGDSFEPGGFWTSHFTDQNEGRIALMMMNKETRVDGLREFMLEYSERAWGDDEDLIFQTLENMSTEERTKLVSGPEGRDFVERVKEDLADNERHMVDALTLIDPKTGKASLNKAAQAAAKIKIAMHGSGAGWDFSSWGTDEDDLLKALDGLTPAQVQEAIQYYNEHLSDGASFMADIAGDMDSDSSEYKVVEAESRGDKLAADTFRLDYAADGWGTDEKLIEETLEAGREGRGGRAKDHLQRLTTRFEATFGQEGGEHHDSKGTGQSALQIMLGDEMEGLERVFFEQLAEKGEADLELELLYSMDGAGTDEERAKKILARVNKMSPEERAAFVRRFEALSVGVLGVDETLEQWVDSDFSGSEGFEMKLLTMGPPRTPEEYLERARMRYDFERSGVVNSIGNGFMDGLEAMGAHSHGALLNQHMGEMEEMFSPDGKLTNPAAFEDLKELAGWQTQDAKNYREVRDKATDYVVTAIQAIGAVVCMIIPGGQAFSAAWIAYLVKFAASMAVTAVSMLAKQALSGNGYGWEQAGIDLAQGVLEAATAGLGGMREFQKAAGAAMAAAKGVVAEAAEQGFKKLAKASLEEAVTGGAQSLISGVITSEAVWEGGGEGALFKHLLKETAMGAIKSGAMSFVGAGMKKTPWGSKLDNIEKGIAGGGPKPPFLKHYGLKYLNEVATAAVGTGLDHNKWAAWAKGEGFDGTLLKGLFIDPAWKSAMQTGISRSSWKRQKEAAGELANAQANLTKYKQMLQQGNADIDNGTLRRLIAGAENTVQEKQTLINKIGDDAVDELQEQVADKERQVAQGRKQLRSKEVDVDEIGSKTEHVAIRREVEEGMDALQDQTRTMRKKIDTGDMVQDEPSIQKRRPVNDTSDNADDTLQRKSRKTAEGETKLPKDSQEGDTELAQKPAKRSVDAQELEDGTERFVVFDNFEQVAGKKAAILGAKALGDDGEFSPELRAKLEKLGYTVRKNNVIARADTGAQVPLHLEDGRIVAGLKVRGKSKTPTHLANELLPGGSRGEIWTRAKRMVGQELTTADGQVVKVTRVLPTVVREGVDSEGQALTSRRIAMVTEDGQILYRPVSDFQESSDPKKVVSVRTADDVEAKPVIRALAKGDTSELTGGDPAAATQVFASAAVRKAVNKHFEDAPDAPAERRRQVKSLLDGFGGDFMAAHASFDTVESKAVKSALNAHRGRLVGSLMAEVQAAFPGLKVKAKRLDPNSPALTFEFEGAQTAHARAFLEDVAQNLFGGSLKRALGVELSDGPVRVKPQPDEAQAPTKPRRVEGDFKDPIVEHDAAGSKDIVVGGKKWGYQTSFAFESEVDTAGNLVMRQRVILVVDDVSDPAVLRTKDDVEKANSTYFNDPAHRIVVDGVERPMKQELEVVLMSKGDAEQLTVARQAAKDTAAAKGEDHGLGADPVMMNVHTKAGDADSSNLYSEGPAAASDDKYRQMVIAHELGHAIWGLADRYQDGWSERANPNYNPSDPSSKEKIWTISGSRAAEDSQHVTSNKGLMEDFNVSYAEGQKKLPTAKSWEDLSSSMEGGLLHIYQKSNKEMPQKADGSYDFALALKRLNPQLAGEDGSYSSLVLAGAELTLPKLTAPDGWGVTPSNLKQLEWTLEAAKHGRVRYELGDGSVPDQVVEAEKNKAYEQPKTTLSKRLVKKAAEHGYDTSKLASSEIEIVKRRSTGPSSMDSDDVAPKREVSKAAAGAKDFSAKDGIKPNAARAPTGKVGKITPPLSTVEGAKAPGADEAMPTPKGLARKGSVETDASKGAPKLSDDELIGPAPGKRVTDPKAGETPLIGLANRTFDPELTATELAMEVRKQGVPRQRRLTGAERKEESDFASMVEADPEAFVRKALAFAQENGSPDSPEFEVDGMKRLMSAYGAGKKPDGDEQREYRLTMNHALHPTAVAIARLAFVARLDQLAKLPPDDPARQVFITNGGCGAGKSDLAKIVKGRMGPKTKFGAVWDAAGEGDALETSWVLQAAQARGLKTVVGYAEADPEQRFEGVLDRAASKARVVDVMTFVNSYADGQAEMKRFMSSPQFEKARKAGMVEAYGILPGQVHPTKFKLGDAGKHLPTFPWLQDLNPQGGQMRAEDVGRLSTNKETALKASLKTLEDYARKQYEAGKDPSAVVKGALGNALKFLPEQSSEVQGAILDTHDRIRRLLDGKAVVERKPATLKDTDSVLSPALDRLLELDFAAVKRITEDYDDFLQNKPAHVPDRRAKEVFAEMVAQAAVKPLPGVDIEDDGSMAFMEQHRDEYARYKQKAIVDGMDDDSIIMLRDRPEGAQNFDGLVPQKSGKVKDTDILFKYKDGRRIITDPEGRITTVLSDFDIADYRVRGQWAGDATLEGAEGAGSRINQNLGVDGIQHGMLTRGLSSPDKARMVIKKLAKPDASGRFTDPDRVIDMLRAEVYVFVKNADRKGFEVAMPMVDALKRFNPEAYETLAKVLPPELAEPAGIKVPAPAAPSASAPAPKAPTGRRPGSTKILPTMSDDEDRATWEGKARKTSKIPKREHDEVPSTDTSATQVRTFNPKATTPTRRAPTRLGDVISEQDRQVLAFRDTSTARTLFADPARRQAVQHGIEASESNGVARRRMMRELLDGFGGDYRAAHETFSRGDSAAVSRALESHRKGQLSVLMDDLQTAFPGVVVHTFRVSDGDPTLRVQLEGSDAHLARAYLETTAGFDHGGSLARSLGLDFDAANTGVMPPLMRADHDDITLDLPESDQTKRRSRQAHGDDLEVTGPMLEVTGPMPELAVRPKDQDVAEDVDRARGRSSGDPTQQQLDAFRRNNMNYDFHEEDVAAMLAERPELRRLVNQHGLTHEEVVAVYAYSRQDYADMNMALRGLEPELHESYRAQIAITSSALDKLPAFRGSVFRRADAGDWLDSFQEGAVVNERAYCSTSTEYDTQLGKSGKGKVEFVIKSRTGKDITQLSGKGELENEVLFDQNTKFTVSQRMVDDDGTVVIYMDEVPAQRKAPKAEPAPAPTPSAPDMGDAPSPVAPKGGKRAKKPAATELDLEDDDQTTLVAAGLTKKEANRIISHREMTGGIFDLDEFVALNPNVNAKMLAKLARVTGREVEAVQAARAIGETEAEAAQRIGLDPMKFGRREEVEDVAEVHNHFKGVLGTEAWAKLAFPDHSEDPVKAAGETVALLRRLYDVDEDKYDEGHNKRAKELFEPTRMRVSYKILDILESPEAQQDPIRALKRVMTASGEMPFDYTYDPRGLLIDHMQESGRAEEFVRATVQELKAQGITYAEMQGKLTTPGVSPELFAKIGEEYGVAIRMLPHLLTSQFSEGGSGFDEHKLQELLFGKNAKADGDVPDMVGGIDICGPESGRWDELGTERLQDAYKVLQRHALLSDRTLVFRPHVGEGYSGTEGQRRHGVEKGAKQGKIAQENLEAILTRLETMQKDKLYAKPPEGKVEVRLGHVTQATASQVARMKQLGVIAEVNIGSNLVTGALGRADEPGGSRLDGHPLLTLLYHDVHTLLSTDAGGVMNTDLAKEYGFAADMLQRFRDGETTITVPDPSDPESSMVLRYEDLPAKVQKRFQVAHLEDSAKAYARLGHMRHNEAGVVEEGGWNWKVKHLPASFIIRLQEQRLAAARAAEEASNSHDLDSGAARAGQTPEERIEGLRQQLDELTAIEGASGSAGASRSDLRRAVMQVREEVLLDLERQLRLKHPGAAIQRTSVGSDRLDIQVVETARATKAADDLEAMGAKILGEKWLHLLGIRLNVPVEPNGTKKR